MRGSRVSRGISGSGSLQHDAGGSVIGKLINHFWEIPPGKMKEFLKDNSLGISDVKELRL